MTGHNGPKLTTSRHWTLPLREASALGFRSTPGGGRELLSVDDEDFHLARAEVTDTDIEPDAVPTCLATTFDSSSEADGSNFEGVGADGAGRVFVLREAESSIVVFNPRLTRIERAIQFHIDRPPDLERDWGLDPNSRGEGLLLLRNGHVLIAKQKEEPWLIELGPKGNSPGGLTDATLLPSGSEFELPDDGERLEVLAAWPVGGVSSLNDLAVDGSGRLHVVSSLSVCIGRLSHDLGVDAPAATFETWRLPREVVADRRDQKAEGLVHWAGHGWLVALDLGEAGRPNLFQIEGVPG